MTSNRTNCVSDIMPEIFDLRETVCERCVDERVKVRPVVEERTVCREEQCCQIYKDCPIMLEHPLYSKISNWQR